MKVTRHILIFFQFQKKRVSFKFQSSMLYFNKNESVLDLTLEKMFDT